MTSSEFQNRLPNAFVQSRWSTIFGVDGGILPGDGVLQSLLTLHHHVGDPRSDEARLYVTQTAGTMLPMRLEVTSWDWVISVSGSEVDIGVVYDLQYFPVLEVISQFMLDSSIYEEYRHMSFADLTMAIEESRRLYRQVKLRRQ